MQKFLYTNWNIWIGLALLFCAGLYLYVVQQLLQIHIWRHDELLYIGNSYEFKLREEGRWFNYLLFPLLRKIPGDISAILNLLFFQGFCLIAINRIVKNFPYALLASFLCIQIFPFFDQIQWPVTSLPSFALLFLASLVVDRLKPMAFYSIFGILYLGSLANFYFLLPFLHYPLIQDAPFTEGVKKYAFTIFPLWCLGFILGTFASLSLVFVLTGQVGLEIASWRKPHPINSAMDLYSNFRRVYFQFKSHISDFFSHGYVLMSFVVLTMIGIFSKKRYSYLLVLGMALPIILAQYAMSLPIGITISTRTVFGTWLGLMAILFYPNVKNWQALVSLPAICFLVFTFAQRNADAMHYYSTVTNTWYNELVQCVPLPPSSYMGIVLTGADEEFTLVEKVLEDRYQLRNRGIPKLGRGYRWVPVALEAGFQTVVVCSYDDGIDHSEICMEGALLPITDDQGLYVVRGVIGDNMLVLSWNLDLMQSVPPSVSQSD
jgi:hypothetical protein